MSGRGRGRVSVQWLSVRKASVRRERCQPWSGAGCVRGTSSGDGAAGEGGRQANPVRTVDVAESWSEWCGGSSIRSDQGSLNASSCSRNRQSFRGSLGPISTATFSASKALSRMYLRSQARTARFGFTPVMPTARINRPNSSSGIDQDLRLMSARAELIWCRLNRQDKLDREARHDSGLTNPCRSASQTHAQSPSSARRSTDTSGSTTHMPYFSVTYRRGTRHR